MQNAINRRAFLRRGVALAGGMALTLSTSLAAFAESSAQGQSVGSRTVPVFALATTRDDVDKACTRHAANKLFASPEAANVNRAHPGCKCQVVRGGELPEATFTALFGNPNAPQRVAVDRRWGWVAQTLK
jgi:hypothetical protein